MDTSLRASSDSEKDENKNLLEEAHTPFLIKVKEVKGRKTLAGLRQMANRTIGAALSTATHCDFRAPFPYLPEECPTMLLKNSQGQI